LLNGKKIRRGHLAGPGLWTLAAFAAPVLAAGAPVEPPATVALVIDTSGSLTPADLAQARDLATGVLQALPPASEVAVFSFDDQSRLVQPRTTDEQSVRLAIEGLRVAGRYTALYDALYDASRYLRDAAGARRAVLLVTDGKDENSALNLEDGLKVAQQTLIPVFCVGVGRVEERVLRRVAKLTGGEYFPSREASASVLAERILAAPEADVTTATASPAASSPAAPATSAGTPAPARADTGPAPPPAAFYRAPLFWAGAGLLLLLAATAVALAGRRPRGSVAAPTPVPSSARLPTVKAEGLPRTVLTRMDVAGDPVERTVLLMDKPVLAVTRGARLGEVLALSEDSAISIGRARANDVVLDDSSVSSQHCRVRPEQGRFVLYDLKSTNGTLVNGRRVERHPLEEGDVIQVGETSLQFRRERQRG
jgi:FHA domain-containing protein/von Willebrand factor type A domain-containing protein